jgi:tRNA A-37 threonylcarbamoyl transferase component Bud32
VAYPHPSGTGGPEGPGSDEGRTIAPAAAPLFAEPLKAGAKVGEGRYEVVAPISAGAMGAVYRARDNELQRDVALKQLRMSRHAARFEIEARLLGGLDHPRVVHVTDSFRDDSGDFLVMNLIEGPDLGEVLVHSGDPGLPVDTAIEYARQTAEALHYVHEQQIVHRDVKPQNLIVGSEGIVLVDFGIARGLDTISGTIGIGTPGFMAPEIATGGQASARSDVFSLAATVWTLISGDPPVYADETKLAEEFEGVTPELEATLRAGLEFLPERRVASVSAFADMLGAPVAEGVGASFVASVETEGKRQRLIEAVVKTCAVVFGAAAASIALLDRRTGEIRYEASWGAGADEIVGVRLARGQGVAGVAAESGEPQVVAECRTSPHFQHQIASGTGYVPHTMLVVPLKNKDDVIGVLSILDRRDGEAFGPSDVDRAVPFAELAVAALAAEAGLTRV